MKQLVQRPVRSKRTPNSDRQHESAEPADHADEATDGADMVGIVGRDVLVDSRLAERDEEAEHEDGHDESTKAHFHMERGRPLMPSDHKIGRWIGEGEGARPPKRTRSSRARGVRRNSRTRCPPYARKRLAGTEKKAAMMPAVLRSRP